MNLTDLNSSWCILPQKCEEEWVLLDKEDVSSSFISESGDWSLVDADQASMENGKDGFSISRDYVNSYPQEWVLNQLRDLIFGPDDLRSGSPSKHLLGAFIARCLSTSQIYLANTPHEHIEMPYSEKDHLNGLLFGAYDKEGMPLPFESQRSTVILISGSFAPQEAYMMGITESYRKKGVQVLAFNCVGFGDNFHLGAPTAQNQIASAEAAFHFIISKNVPISKLFFHGYSMGGYSALELAAKYSMDLILDRVSESIYLESYTVAKICLPYTLSIFAAQIIGNTAHFGVPFNLDKLKKFKGRIFAVQEVEDKERKTGAVTFIQELLKNQQLMESQVSFSWIHGGHFTTFCQTWTVSQKIADKIQERASQEKYNHDARRLWKHFIKLN